MDNELSLSWGVRVVDEVASKIGGIGVVTHPATAHPNMSYLSLNKHRITLNFSTHY
jgi:hypothetical protein